MSLVKREQRTWPAESGWSEERIERAFRDMFRDFFTGRTLAERFTDGMVNPMHIEEFVEDGTGVIRAELPGFDPEKDVELTIHDGMLDVKAHREERKEEQRGDGYRTEFRYGSFRRSIPLPESATEADVKATYHDGILEVRVPLAQPEAAPEPKRIAVEHG